MGGGVAVQNWGAGWKTLSWGVAARHRCSDGALRGCGGGSGSQSAAANARRSLTRWSRMVSPHGFSGCGAAAPPGWLPRRGQRKAPLNPSGAVAQGLERQKLESGAGGREIDRSGENLRRRSYGYGLGCSSGTFSRWRPAGLSGTLWRGNSRHSRGDSLWRLWALVAGQVFLVLAGACR